MLEMELSHSFESCLRGRYIHRIMSQPVYPACPDTLYFGMTPAKAEEPVRANGSEGLVGGGGKL